MAFSHGRVLPWLKNEGCKERGNWSLFWRYWLDALSAVPTGLVTNSTILFLQPVIVFKNCILLTNPQSDLRWLSKPWLEHGPPDSILYSSRRNLQGTVEGPKRAIFVLKKSFQGPRLRRGTAGTLNLYPAGKWQLKRQQNKNTLVARPAVHWDCVVRYFFTCWW